ncbi:hypothetical protein [Paraburkholderia graminis]|uniref:hypothetical protein n=1 Tax=Paraburkholderia graminis TaxID=60548 RepID=UPI0038BBC4F0
MLPMTLIDPRQTVLIESGTGLDVIGAMSCVNLPRAGLEADADYRARLMMRLWAPLVAELIPAVGTGEYLDHWCINNRAPDEEAKPNHVRDAVRANQ